MRHQVSGRHLGRTTGHRVALRRNLAASLFEYETISTTPQKAKFVKPFAEKLITLAKGGTLHNRRRAISMLQDRDICKVEDGDPVKVGSVIQKLFNEIGPRFAERNGGYTRIVALPFRRIGDNGQLVLLQLVQDKKAKVAEIASDSSAVVISPEEEIQVEAESVGAKDDEAGKKAGSAIENEASEEAKDSVESEEEVLKDKEQK